MLETITDQVNGSLKGTFLDTKGRTNINTGERVISIAAGGLLFYKGLTQAFKHPFFALQEAAAGGFLLFRGATGYCPIYAKIGKDTTDPEAVSITERLVVDRPKEEIYQFWRKLENLSRFMKHLESVEQLDDNISHWKIKTPGSMLNISWNAEITREEENAYIGWQSVSGSQIDNAGKVEFKDAASGIGTELNIEINYFPPAGGIGHGAAKLLNGVFKKMVHDDIMNFKHYIEGEDYRQYTAGS